MRLHEILWSCHTIQGCTNICAVCCGMPGSKTALEELMSRVLGDLLKEDIVAKIADDLYRGGNSLDQLLLNWKNVLQALHKCDLRIQNDRQPSVHNDTRLGLELWHLTCQPAPHRRSCLLPRTCHCNNLVPRVSHLTAPWSERGETLVGSAHVSL